ncbi:hypothetical protein [Kordia sp.]
MKKQKIKSLKINKLNVSDMNPEVLRGGLRESDWTDLSECCAQREL